VLDSRLGGTFDQSHRSTTAEVGGSLHQMSPPRRPRARKSPAKDGLSAPSVRPTAIDLFSGAGGLSLGFEQAGFDVLAAAEYDPIHAAVHAFNFPTTEMVCRDLSYVTAPELRTAAQAGWKAHGRDGRWNGRLDVLIGGPPCQGFSWGGKQATDDERNWLVFHFARLVGELRPRYFVMENVPGMAMAPIEFRRETRLLDVLLELFNKHGYDVAKPCVLNAASWGVPQERKRLILLGTRRGQTPLRYPAAKTVPRRRRSDEREALIAETEVGALCPTVWEAIGDLPDADAHEALLTSDEFRMTSLQLAEIRAKMSPYARVLHGLDRDPDDYSWPRISESDLLTSSCRTTHRADVVSRFQETDPGTTEAVSRFFRLDAAGVSSTLRAGTHYERGSFNAPRPIHPKLPRVITVREAARLHSFPDWFRLHWTKWHGFREVGNSVPPRFGRAVGAEVRRALGVHTERPTTPMPLGDPSLLRLENLEAADHFGADLGAIPRNALRVRPAKPSARAA
jgi:DNA (cytosine-5)-methyltransferase 1